MANYRTSRIFPIILVLIIVVVAVVGLVYIIQVLFFSGGQGTTISQIDASRESLISTAENRAVSVTVRGPIVADEDYRTYLIRVSSNDRALTTYKGYLDQKIDSTLLRNNIPAYEQFVYALNRLGLMNSAEFTGSANDTRGICPLGFLYEFQIYQESKSLKMLWTTSCSASRGSLGQAPKTLTSFFIKQIPGADIKVGKLWQ